MSGHVPTVPTAESAQECTDNSYYVNLSVADHSPTVITAGHEGVLTSDVRTPQPLPRTPLDTLLDPYRPNPATVAGLLAGRRERAEHQHAPAPAEPQETLEELAARIRSLHARPEPGRRWMPVGVIEDGTVRLEWPAVLHEALDGWELAARTSDVDRSRDLERIAEIRTAVAATTGGAW
jgi:hypothetical protein